MKVLQGILLFIISHSINAQAVDEIFRINIKTKYNNINIHRSSDFIKIKYALKDSLSEKKLLDNKQYRSLINQFVIAREAKNKNLLESIVYQIDSIEVSTYSIDSLVLKPTENVEYLNLIKKVYSASTDQLENVEANKNRILLDGTTFKINIRSDSGSRIVYAQSPTKDSHPLLAELIDKTMVFYQKKR